MENLSFRRFLAILLIATLVMGLLLQAVQSLVMTSHELSPLDRGLSLLGNCADESKETSFHTDCPVWSCAPSVAIGCELISVQISPAGSPRGEVPTFYSDRFFSPEPRPPQNTLS